MLEYKYYVVYQTTCKLNNKIYIGQHRTNNLDDDYLGSGKILQEDIKKYGKDNFQREILYIFNNFKDMNDKEMELVTPEFVERDDTYNLIIGGQQDDYQARLLGAKKANEAKLRNGTMHLSYLDRLTEDQQKKMAEKRTATIRKRISTGEIPDVFHNFLGKHHTEESKQKIGRKNAESQKGSRNSQFGKHWYMDPKTGESRILLDSDVPDGWIKGRSINSDKKILRYCKYCGAIIKTCKYPEICKRVQALKSWKNIFHPNDNIFGSILIYDILLSDISLIEKLKLSGMSMTEIQKYLQLEAIPGSTFYSCCNNIRSFKQFLI